MQEELQIPAKHRLDHSYIWLGTLRTLPYFVFALAMSSVQGIMEIFAIVSNKFSDIPFFAFMQSSPLAIIIILIIALAVIGAPLILLLRYLCYKHIWYEYSDAEFSYCSGIFSKKRVHIPYSRIQSVNQKASLLQRVVGVCSVSIETAGGAANKAVVIPYIKRLAAEELRKDLFARKQKTQDAADIEVTTQDTSNNDSNILDAPVKIASEFCEVFSEGSIDTGAVLYEYGLSNKQLLLSAITNRTSLAVIFASFIGFVMTAFSYFALIIGANEDEIFESVFTGAAQVLSAQLINTSIAFIGIFVLVMLIIWITTVINTCLKYGGFKARRRGQRIETELGILSHNYYGIDIDRIQSIEVSQSFFQRLCKACSISLERVISGTQEQASNSQNVAQSKLVIHPFVKLERAPEILKEILPEWDAIPECMQVLPKRAMRRAIIRRAVLQGYGFWIAVVMVLAELFLRLPFVRDVLSVDDAMFYLDLCTTLDYISIFVFAICALLFILNIISAVLWHRESCFGYNQSFLSITNGGFGVTRSIFPRQKLQLMSLRANPFQRRQSLATIKIVTAAGIGSSSQKLIDVEESSAQQWFAWCHPGNASLPTNSTYVTSV